MNKTKGAAPAKRSTVPSTKSARWLKAIEALAPGAGRRFAADIAALKPHPPLIDALVADARVARLEGNEPPLAVAKALLALESPVKLDLSWAESVDETLTARRFLEGVASRVESKGVVLLDLEPDADRHAIVILARSRVNITLAAMSAASQPARIIAGKAIVEKPKTPVKRVRGGAALEEWPDCSLDPSNTWRYFVDAEGARSLCLRKWPQAIDLMHQDLTPTQASRSEKKSFPTPRECAGAYVTLYEELQRDGWRQYSSQEHAKAVKALSPKGRA